MTKFASTGLFAFHRIIWAMPAVFIPHIVEEYAGGFPHWVTGTLHGTFDNLAFALNNAAFIAIFVALTSWTSLRRTRLAAFCLMAWASGNLFWDALFHVFATAAYNRYSPGLVTASVLYLPLFLVVSWASVHDDLLNCRSLVGALAIGLTLMAFMIWYGLFHFAM